MFNMNRLNIADRAKIIGMLTEGNSMRATSRMADVSINTVTKLLVDVGAACAAYQHETLRNLPCKRLQLDEIWGFCYAKEKNVPASMQDQYGVGDVWTWTAIDAETKLVPTWLVGLRDAYYAGMFVRDVASRLSSRVQITSDGHKPYLQAVKSAFELKVDYAMLVKIYGEPAGGPQERRYSPAECSGYRNARCMRRSRS